MAEAIQILTIIIDVLIIFFVSFLVLIGWQLFSVVRRLGKLARNASDMRFWFNIIKNIPRYGRKKKE